MLERLRSRLDESLIIYPEVEYLFAEVNQSPEACFSVPESPRLVEYSAAIGFMFTIKSREI